MSEKRISFRDEGGRRGQCSYAAAASLAVERLTPIRVPRSYRGKVGLVGHFFFSTTGQSVVCDSRLEMDHALLLDFDADVEAALGQPVRFHFEDAEPHVPDFFARRRDGGGHVYDVKPLDQQQIPKNEALFDRTAEACAEIGWEYSVVGELPEILKQNILLLAGFRAVPQDPFGIADAIVDACSEPQTIQVLTRSLEINCLVRPIILHLIWRHVLACDIDSRLLDRDSLVWLADGSEGGV